MINIRVIPKVQNIPSHNQEEAQVPHIHVRASLSLDFSSYTFNSCPLWKDAQRAEGLYFQGDTDVAHFKSTCITTTTPVSHSVLIEPPSNRKPPYFFTRLPGPIRAGPSSLASPAEERGGGWGYDLIWQL